MVGAPAVDGAAPSERNQGGGNCGHENDIARDVDALEACRPAQVALVFDAEENKQDYKGN